MAKYVFVQIRGVEKPAQIQADVIEREDHDYLIKRGGTLVGKFAISDVQGWWISGEDDKPTSQFR